MGNRLRRTYIAGTDPCCTALPLGARMDEGPRRLTLAGISAMARWSRYRN